MTFSPPEPRSAVGLETVRVGHEFPPAPLDFSRESVVSLLESLEAQLPQGEDGEELVPPSVVASLSLGALLRQTTLPPGALHASQEVHVRRPIPVGVNALCRAVVANTSQRAGMTIISLNFSVWSRPDDAEGGDELATGAGAVMFAHGNA